MPPGSLVRIANEEIRAFFQTKLPNNQLGLSDLLALLTLKGESPERIAIIGIDVDRYFPGLAPAPKTSS